MLKAIRIGFASISSLNFWRASVSGFQIASQAPPSPALLSGQPLGVFSL